MSEITSNITSVYGSMLRSYIAVKRPSLADAQSRIDYGVAAGKLTTDEADELTAIATEGAPLLEGDQVIRNLITKVEMLAEAQLAQGEVIAEIVALIKADEISTPAPLPDGVEDWYPPTGAHDAPGKGDKRRYQGLIYISNIDANTTVPGSDPRWWSAWTPDAGEA